MKPIDAEDTREPPDASGHLAFRQATVSDKERIWQFLRSAYGSHSEYRFPARWIWEFADNPYREGRGLPIWIALAGEEVVGQSCGMYVPLKMGNRHLIATWGVDTVVRPDYRRRGIASRLQQMNSVAQRVFFSLAMHETVRRIKQALGAKELPPVGEYWLVYRMSARTTRDVTRRLMRNWTGGGPPQRAASPSLLDHLGAAVLNMVALGVRCAWAWPKWKSLRAARCSDVVIRKIERFDAAADDLWERTNTRYHALVRRDRQYLNWKFVDQPNMEYCRFGVYHGERLDGFVVVRKARPPEPSIGIIADVYAARDDGRTMTALIQHALEFLGGRVERIECAASTEELRHILRRFGFIQVRKKRPMMFCDAEDRVELDHAPPDAWFFGKGDQDWDQYPVS